MISHHIAITPKHPFQPPKGSQLFNTQLSWNSLHSQKAGSGSSRSNSGKMKSKSPSKSEESETQQSFRKTLQKKYTSKKSIENIYINSN
jgi:hypothetical protein